MSDAKMTATQSEYYRQMRRGIIAIIVLTLCLVLTSIALAWSVVTRDNNTFATGGVQIDLNGGQPVIQEDEYLFEPGMTVEKEFYIQSASTWDCYFRIYLANIEGGLADVLEVSILDGDRVLCSSTASKMTRTTAEMFDSALAPGERRYFKIRFHFPEASGNASQSQVLMFSLCADAVQAKNNPDKLMD